MTLIVLGPIWGIPDYGTSLTNSIFSRPDVSIFRPFLSLDVGQFSESFHNDADLGFDLVSLQGEFVSFVVEMLGFDVDGAQSLIQLQLDVESKADVKKDHGSVFDPGLGVEVATEINLCFESVLSRGSGRDTLDDSFQLEIFGFLFPDFISLLHHSHQVLLQSFVEKSLVSSDLLHTLRRQRHRGFYGGGGGDGGCGRHGGDEESGGFESEKVGRE